MGHTCWVVEMLPLLAPTRGFRSVSGMFAWSFCTDQTQGRHPEGPTGLLPRQHHHTFLAGTQGSSSPSFGGREVGAKNMAHRQHLLSECLRGSPPPRICPALFQFPPR